MIPPGDEHLIPYAPDFTPRTLGKEIGEDEVLRWLLEQARDLGSKADLATAIVDTCLQHVTGATRDRDRRDMASHVIQGLRNYHLVEESEDGLALTPLANKLLAATPDERDKIFAVHILTRCNGYRLVQEIERHRLLGVDPTMEQLARRLDRNPTAKSLSTAKAWLARAGVFSGTTYSSIRSDRVTDLLGERTELLLGLEPAQAEFIISLILLTQQRGTTSQVASDVADLTEERSEVILSRKGLGSFVQRLERLGLVVVDMTRGKGGSKSVVRPTFEARRLGEAELRGLVDQDVLGYRLSMLKPLATVLHEIHAGSTAARGIAGEMLAVHLALMLGLEVKAWRKRAPHAEIDLIAERLASLGYQRWAVQVKNIGDDAKLDSDRVYREVGAVAGSGVTHILFVVPRGTVTSTAMAEMKQRSRIANLHIYYLHRDHLGENPSPAKLVRALRGQSEALGILKRTEAERRERLLDLD